MVALCGGNSDCDGSSVGSGLNFKNLQFSILYCRVFVEL